MSDDQAASTDLTQEIQAIFDEARDRALALIAAKAGHASAPAPRWLKLKAAAAELSLHTDTLTARARRHGLGRQEGRRGQWLIDMNRVEAWQQGRPYSPLPQGDQEDSADRSPDSGTFPDDVIPRRAAESDQHEG